MTSFSLTSYHSAPVSIRRQVAMALSYYPELRTTTIAFKFKKNIRKSTMLAQPTLQSLFRQRKKREYVILISERFKISGRQFLTKDVSEGILIGWLGHELGHLMDYKDRGILNLIWFGIQYFFSGSYIKEAERAADTYAVASGMGNYILDTKNFILDHAEIPQEYKDRIKRFYLSPEEIMAMVAKADAE